MLLSSFSFSKLSSFTTSEKIWKEDLETECRIYNLLRTLQNGTYWEKDNSYEWGFPVEQKAAELATAFS